jgi:predicted nucleic acid-binding protein
MHLNNFLKGIDAIICPIVSMELLQGAQNEIETVKISNYLNKFQIDLIDDKISLKSIELIKRFSKKFGLRIPDAMIAAHCIIRNYELFTFNKKDFRFINDLKLFEI